MYLLSSNNLSCQYAKYDSDQVTLTDVKGGPNSLKMILQTNILTYRMNINAKFNAIK